MAALVYPRVRRLLWDFGNEGVIVFRFLSLGVKASPERCVQSGCSAISCREGNYYPFALIFDERVESTISGFLISRLPLRQSGVKLPQDEWVKFQWLRPVGIVRF